MVTSESRRGSIRVAPRLPITIGQTRAVPAPASAHPQVAAMQMVLDVERRTGGTLRLAGVPLNLSATPAEPGGAPPRLGEHTDDILKNELGLDDTRIAALRKEGAI